MDASDALRQFAESGFEQKIEDAMEKACLILVRSAKEKCPVGKSGELRSSLNYQVIDNDGLITGEVGTNVEYAPYVEIGTGIYSSQGDGRKDVPWKYKDAKGKWHTTSGQNPQPYLQPALQENRDKIQKCFEGII